MVILSIDTSCDETSAAVTIGDRVVSNIVSSQVELHKKWGGVVPIIAKRAHEERIESVVKEALKRASSPSLDAIAVTQGPGLAPALEVGIRYAKKLSQEYTIPLIAVNHMEGHLLSPFAKNRKGKTPGGISVEQAPFPLVGLLISGGHTEMVRVNAIGSYQVLGETLDDAIGEAYDKVAKMIDVGYPGGPIIETLAREGNAYAYNFPIPMVGRKDMDFSYSGLKTAVRYTIEDIQKTGTLTRRVMSDISASFQRVAVSSLVDRLGRAVTVVKPTGVLLGGGVISNIYVRRTIRTFLKKNHIPVYIPSSKKLFTDNAAMIGVAAYFKAQRGEFVTDMSMLDRSPNLHFDTSAHSR